MYARLKVSVFVTLIGSVALGETLPTAGPPSAKASTYVRSESHGAPVGWAASTLVVTVYAPEPATGLSLREVEADVHSAAASWLDDCSRLRVDVRTSTKKPRSSKDGQSSVVIRSAAWCPDSAKYQQDCYDPRQRANTTLRFSEHSELRGIREIVEADIAPRANNW